MFHDLKQHGNTSWKYDLLLRTSLLWMISERRNWRRRFEQVVKLYQVPSDSQKRLTFEGFLKAVRREYEVMTIRMASRLREVMFEIDPALRQVGGRDVFAVDGTSLELPRTRANQEFFCGDEVDIDNEECTWKLAPQMQLTTLWHVRLQLPWQWNAGPGNTDERNDLREMVGGLPKNAVLVADAGFVGYDLWSAVFEQGVDLVVRVGSNVHLIEELQPVPGRDDLYSFWPHAARRAGHPPRLMRLVKTKFGKTEAFLLTNVLDPTELSDQDVVEIYKARWGVEVFYRGLKQTFGRRRLRARTPDSALAELHLSMLSLWMLHLMGTLASQQLQASTPELPALSTVGLLDSVRDAMTYTFYQDRKSFEQSLAAAQLDNYQRKKDKRSRRYPRQNQQKKCGAPVFRPPKHEEKTKLRSLIKNGYTLATAV